MKLCNHCKTYKDFKHFYRDKLNKGGHRHECKSCTLSKSARRYKQDKLLKTQLRQQKEQFFGSE